MARLYAALTLLFLCACGPNCGSQQPEPETCASLCGKAGVKDYSFGFDVTCSCHAPQPVREVYVSAPDAGAR